MNLYEYCSNSERPLKMVLGSFPGIKLNNFTFKETYTDPYKMSKVALDFDSLFKLDFIRTITDLVFECEILGVYTNFPPMSHPFISRPIVNSNLDIAKVRYKLDKSQRFFIYKEAYRQVKEQTDTPLVASITGPLTILASLTSQDYFRYLMKNNDIDNIKLLLEIITNLSLDLVSQLNTIKPHCLMVSDPVASFLTPSQFNNFLLPALNQIFNQFKDMTILHICGDINSILNNVFMVKAQGISVDETLNIENVLTHAPAEKVILGNISPISTMLNKQPFDVELEAKELLKHTKQYSNFIPATGCTLPYKTPMENIKSFIDA
ncbi:hypothetical protein HYG86_16410 [Alkalicella caledoniensis]|uniref:Uroporphyrinogen decarboxylase (URO-D) domain-containing protein n=1 Tax=Alkalicella caledoniensis TaxID=2731377 RepID=A0A7G9WC28_ALKCA|nr:uroporphyrinogen decarboxylase family protein [Alkalicella caledoniensis]QNO16240.1 hypothetical protein HYG86_16410 [Alkalicella caledoniensis]